MASAFNTTIFPSIASLGDGSTNANLWTAAAASAGVLLLYSQLAKRSDGFTYLPGIPLIGSWSFFTKRSDFLKLAIEANRAGKVSKFSLLNHNVVVATGEKGRKAFFSGKGLNLEQGYSVLWGGIPDLKDVATEAESTDDAAKSSLFFKRLHALLRRDRLQKVIPVLFADLENCMNSWPQQGRINPFNEIYNLVVQMTTRALGVKEIADDPVILGKLAELYFKVEESTSPSSVLLPWFPSRSRNSRKEATTALYTLISDTLKKRQDEGRTEEDPAQYMFDQGDSVHEIVSFVMNATFAGIINTGITICWMMIFIHVHPEWNAKLRKELSDLLAAHSPNTSLPITTRLAHVPVDAWEDATPVLEAIIAESMRISVNGTTLRRNIAGDVDVDGLTVKRGEFMAYPLQAMHLNADVYSEPTAWKPERWMDPKQLEAHRAEGTFLAWGTGLHPCLGMRFAKLEMKLIAALYINLFEYTRVNKNGVPSQTIPVPNYNDLYRATPEGEDVYFEYKRIPGTE